MIQIDNFVLFTSAHARIAKGKERFESASA